MQRDVPTPSHTPDESARLFRAIHAVARQLIERGSSVIIDATSLLERDRRPIHEIAAVKKTPLVILLFDAPRKMVEERLQHRISGADISVYIRMEDTLQAPSRPYTRIDTSDAAATEAAFRQVVEVCRPQEAAGTGGRA